MATDECQPLQMNWTPWRSIASVTALTAFSGLDWLSIQTISISRFSPSIVSGRSPSALASSSASLTPFLISSPVRLAGPVNGPSEPILSGPLSARSAVVASRKAALAAVAAPAFSMKPRRDSAAAGSGRPLVSLRSFMPVLRLQEVPPSGRRLSWLGPQAPRLFGSRPDRHHGRPRRPASTGKPGKRRQRLDLAGSWQVAGCARGPARQSPREAASLPRPAT
jgi:hypothetical protein